MPKATPAIAMPLCNTESSMRGPPLVKANVVASEPFR